MEIWTWDLTGADAWPEEWLIGADSAAWRT